MIYQFHINFEFMKLFRKTSFRSLFKMNMDCVLMLPDNKSFSEELLLPDAGAQKDMLPSYSQPPFKSILSEYILALFSKLINIGIFCIPKDQN